MSWWQLWQYLGAWKLIGWAWAAKPSVDRFNFNCGSHHMRLLKESPDFWQTIFRPSVSYQGSPEMFHVWGTPDQKFIGWFYIGRPTATQIKMTCQYTEVLTQYGAPIMAS